MRLKQSGQRAALSPFLTPDMPKTRANMTSPFGQRVIAWVNGTHFFQPLTSPTVRKRKPRTEHIDFGQQYCDATQGW